MSKTVGTESGSVVIPDSFSKEFLEGLTKPSIYSTWLTTASTSVTPSIYKTASTSSSTWLPLKTRELTEEEESIVGEAIAEQIATGKAVKDEKAYIPFFATAATSSVKITGTFTKSGTFTLDESVAPDETTTVTWKYDEV